MSRAVRKAKVYELYEYDKLLMIGTTYEIAEKIGRSRHYVTKLRAKPTKQYSIIEIGIRHQIYALYDDETFITTGTLEQIAEETGMDTEQLRFIRSNIAEERNLKKRLIALEGEIMIQRKGIKEKYAPKTVKARQENIEVHKTRPVAPVEWKPNPYSKLLFDQCFKGWGS